MTSTSNFLFLSDDNKEQTIDARTFEYILNRIQELNKASELAKHDLKHAEVGSTQRQTAGTRLTFTEERAQELVRMAVTLNNEEQERRAQNLKQFNRELETGLTMGRTTTLEQYDVDDLGIIRSPGKFEGEPIYTPYFWEVLMNGDGTPTYDDNGNEWTEIQVNDEERAEFPELRNAQNIALTVNNEGFIFIIDDTDPAYKCLNDDNAPADEDEQPAGLQHENGTL